MTYIIAFLVLSQFIWFFRIRGIQRDIFELEEMIQGMNQEYYFRHNEWLL
jgi:hypothetical protein